MKLKKNKTKRFLKQDSVCYIIPYTLFVNFKIISKNKEVLRDQGYNAHQ
jgi:hypothetical protein